MLFSSKRNGMGASISNTRGFTLVEISIVMIIIGLLIGGTFGSMKLIENMEVNRTIQDLKTVESAALTFKDMYGRLPGDLANTASRLPNCNTAPCSTGGNGDRILDAGLYWTGAITQTNERFTFWSHLQAADLLQNGVKNTTDMNFAEGQPETAIGGGIRLAAHTGGLHLAGGWSFQGAIALITFLPSATMDGLSWTVDCGKVGRVDTKIDDGFPYNGKVVGWSCTNVVALTSLYNSGNRGVLTYDLKGF